MTDRVRSVQAFSLTRPRPRPYLGDAGKGETVNSRGYLVRKGNRTVYPVFDRSILVRTETEGGVVGWGETYGLVAPRAVGAIIEDLLADFVTGRDPSDPEAIYDDLYDLMRVRGYTGGFYVDALAAIDIALWDIAGRLSGASIAELLGGRVRDRIPAYVSGLPEPTLDARARLAKSFQEKGFSAFKFAFPSADEGPEKEIETLRRHLGDEAKIAADMHWMHGSQEAIGIIQAMNPHGLWFAEAPVRTEDIGGLESVCRASPAPVAVGEEWRTHWDLLNRIERCRIAIVQPEMGHKGVTNFKRIVRLAEQRGLEVIPHATIGTGIFLAASLQVGSTSKNVAWHEFQHSIFDPNRDLWIGDMECADGHYTPPGGPGLGVRPSEKALDLLEPV